MRTYTVNELKAIVETVLFTTIRRETSHDNGVRKHAADSMILDLHQFIDIELGRLNEKVLSSEEAREAIRMGILRTPPLGYNTSRTETIKVGVKTKAYKEFDKYFDNL